MTSISVISPSVDKDSVPTLSTMIDPESSINNLADHAAAHQKLGTVQFILESLSQLNICHVYTFRKLKLLNLFKNSILKDSEKKQKLWER